MAMQLQHNSWKTMKLNSQATEQARLLTVALQHRFLVSAILSCLYDSFACLDVMKIDEAANFVFGQLVEQEPGICDKCCTDYARQDKIDLAWIGISCEMKESGPWLSSFETI
jgi:hypothetical protein